MRTRVANMNACVEQAYVCLRTTTKQSARASVLLTFSRVAYCPKYTLEILLYMVWYVMLFHEPGCLESWKRKWGGNSCKRAVTHHSVTCRKCELSLCPFNSHHEGLYIIPLWNAIQVHLLKTKIRENYDILSFLEILSKFSILKHLAFFIQVISHSMLCRSLSGFQRDASSSNLLLIADDIIFRHHAAKKLVHKNKVSIFIYCPSWSIYDYFSQWNIKSSSFPRFFWVISGSQLKKKKKTFEQVGPCYWSWAWENQWPFGFNDVKPVTLTHHFWIEFKHDWKTQQREYCYPWVHRQALSLVPD